MHVVGCLPNRRYTIFGGGPVEVTPDTCIMPFAVSNVRSGVSLSGSHHPLCTVAITYASEKVSGAVCPILDEVKRCLFPFGPLRSENYARGVCSTRPGSTQFNKNQNRWPSNRASPTMPQQLKARGSDASPTSISRWCKNPASLDSNTSDREWNESEFKGNLSTHFETRFQKA